MLKAFPPITDEKSVILILGTMPSVKSLEKGEYYAHPQNAFWRILFELLGTPYSSDFEDKKNLFLNHHLALWDVLSSCEREGSSDSNIKNREPNDFKSFLTEFPDIQYIFFNGKKAQEFFEKTVKDAVHLPFKTLPSTSPANTMCYEKKLEIWSEILAVKSKIDKK